MKTNKKSYKEVLIKKLTKEGKVKNISLKVYRKFVKELAKDMTEVENRIIN